MADNTVLSSNVGTGDTIASASLSFSGDTAKVQCMGEGILSGSEGSWTYSLLVGGAGAVAAGVQRVTLASDDPAVTSLGVMDDWDETDRCKVNIIVGSAGVDGNSGNKSAATVRVVLATDQPALTNKLLVTPDLPTNASTASKQPALGTAGTASADVITVQGIASMTALKVDASATTQPVSIAATVTVTGAGGTFPVTDSGGSLTVDAPVGTPVYVRLSDGSAAITTLPVSLATVPSHAVTNAGVFVVQENGAALTSLQLIDDAVYAEDVAAQAADKGIALLAVRRDTASTMVNADNDYTNLIVDSSGRLHVNVGNSVAVTGTFWQATQPVSVAATVTVTGAGGTFPVTDSGGSLTIDAPVGTPAFVRLSDGSAAITTLPVSMAAVPTGASTAAKQPALGTAGTASADVITVQGIASMTPLLSTLSGTNNIATVTTVTTVSAVTTLNQFNGTTVATNSGSKDAGTLRVVLATDQPQLTNKLLVTPDANSAVNVAQMNGVTVTMGNGASGTGVQRVTIANDSTGVVALAAGTAAIGTVQPGNTANTTPWLVTDTPSISGGLSKFHLVATASTNANNVKAGPGQVYSITAFNVSATPYYLKFHNTASTPTAGTGVTDTYLIPGNTAGAGIVINIDKGIIFSTGIGISVVAGIADADGTSIAASSVVLNVYFK